MKTTLLLASTLLLALPGAGRAGIFPYETHVETLDNGLEVILVPMNSEGLVSYWTIVRTGSRDEYEPGRTGFAHFFEHMMFRGTEKYPQEVYNDLLTELGANNNAFTTSDFTGYTLEITNADLEIAADVESDRFRNLSYPQEAFRTEAGAVFGEYRKNRSSPFFTAQEALRRAAFDRHTYRHTAMGFVEDIQAMPTMYDYSKTFFDRYYRPENTVLLISGDIEVEPTMELIRKHYGGWQPGYQAPKVESEPEQTAERRLEVAYEGRTLPILWIGYKAPAFDAADESWAAADLLTDLLFGETSEIYNKLVLAEQVVEFIQADLDMARDPTLLDVIARVKDPEKVDYVLAEIDRVIAGAQQSPPDAARLADQKSRSKYGFLMDLDTPGAVNGSLARIIATTGGIAALETYFETMSAVDPADVQQAATAVLQPQRRTVVTLEGES